MSYEWKISDIKRENRTSGYHFFEANALRFFNSKISSTVYQGEGGVFFVTSEQFVPTDGSPPYPRMFTVRRFMPETGDVRTASTFQEFKTVEEARAAARYYAEHKPEEV